MPLRHGAKMISPCFDKIGENNKFDLTELKVSGYEEAEVTIDEVYLDILNNNGTTAVQYEYIDSPDDDFPAGWYLDYEAVEVGDCPIEAGDGIWVTAEPNFKFTFAGQVIEEGRAIALRHGALGVGNMLARTIDLTELKVTGYEEAEVTIDEVYLDILNNNGTTAVQYEYIDSPDDDFAAGWYLDYEAVSEGDQTFAPAEGMWVTAEPGFYLEFPDL